jgi:hypothetical protein
MSKILDLTALTPRVRATPFRTENRAFCPTCQKPVDLMSIEKTAEFYKTNVEEIKSLTHNTVLHPIHNNRGNLMICAESLFAFFERRETQLLDPSYVSSSSLNVC